MSHPPTPNEQAPPGQHPPQTPPSPNHGLRIGLGLGLLALALLATVIAYLLPTLRTVTMSFEESAGFFGEGPPDGTENYSDVLGGTGFLQGFASLTPVILGTVVTGAVIAPLVAWCVHNAGSGTRMAARIVGGIAVIVFAPAAMTIAEVVEHLAGDRGYADLSLNSWTMLISGMVFGAGILVALAAFRGGEGTVKPTRAVVTAAGLTAFALVAASLQTFTFPYISGFPSPPGMTPLSSIFNDGFRLFAFGSASAKATILLAILAVLGIGAALLFILTRTRIEISPGPGSPKSFNVGAGVSGILLLALFAAGTLVNLLPWLTRLTGPVESRFNETELMIDTWAPPLITTAIAITTALAGGFAIGALRPLGDGSRWLLLPFAPWLFVTSGPLALANYESLAEAEALFTFQGLIPRAWIAVPALFVFTALFWGLEDRRRSMTALGAPASKANGAFAAAAWPLVALVGMIVWLVHAQDTAWQMLAGDQTVNALMQGVHTFYTEVSGLAIGYPIPLMVFFAAAMVLAAVFYLPRVGIRVGR